MVNLYKQTFEKIDFALNPLEKGEYEQCKFSHCNFEQTDLSKIIFSDCQFTNCNMSNAKLGQTGFRESNFKDCKLLGMPFENCQTFLFAVSFENCLLNVSSFYKLPLKKTMFKKCSLQEVDFGEADLSLSTFYECDLLGATFDKSNLEKADFRTAINYQINPETNRIKKAKFSHSGLAGLLVQCDIVIE